MFQNPEQVLLIASVILFLSIFAGKAGYRFGLPALLLFLGVGMLFGRMVWASSSAIRMWPSLSACWR